MPFGHRHKRATEGFRKVRAIDKTQGDNTGDHRININLPYSHRVGHRIERDLQPVENQQH